MKTYLGKPIESTEETEAETRDIFQEFDDFGPIIDLLEEWVVE